MATKLERGFYPISYGDIRRGLETCERWGYGNKDACKYVAETIIDRIDSMELPIKDDLYSDLVSISHDLNSGANFKGQLLITFK
jgi:hypothetical protein